MTRGSRLTGETRGSRLTGMTRGGSLADGTGTERDERKPKRMKQGGQVVS